VRILVRRYSTTLAAIAGLWVVAAIVGVYIVAHQNGEFPRWMPIVGDDPYVVSAELPTAQGVIPGQGQLIEVAGVVVGRVSNVHLEHGVAVLSLHLQRGKVKLFRDASILLRPRTLLKDMILQVTPGRPSAGVLREGDRIPVSNTLSDVNVDDLLSALDTDTQSALMALAQGAGEGIGGQSDELSRFFRRFDPTMRLLRQINAAMIGRRRELARAVTNFSRVSEALGSHGRELTQFVNSSNAVFGALASEQRGVRGTLARLPAALRDLRASTARFTPVAQDLGSASRKLLPGARALGGGAQALNAMFGATLPALRTQLRPFARAAREPATELRGAVRGMPRTSTDASDSVSLLNRFFNAFAYAAPGSNGASGAFWSAWAAHQLNSVLSSEDAQGAFAHTLTMTTCESLHLLPGFEAGDPALALDVSLANIPTVDEVCAG
jgi:phospholipid/cholesterol/gamma-HCH transport system substrate-binding protein